MKTIESKIFPITSINSIIPEILNTKLNFNESDSKQIFAKKILPHFVNMSDDCYFVTEYPYVDKMYRDSYYNYYSTKSNNYDKNCLRISIFDSKVDESDFRNSEKIEELQNKYLGFIVIRPIIPYVIGRSMISPKALKLKGFEICTVEQDATVKSIKFKIDAFPHSSQDTETITCAETSLWMLMEYFGNKYSEYRTVLPSAIINVLNKVSYERQIPSIGLNVLQMSFSLREFGFGTKIYSKDEYESEFDNLFSCYIESGIPVIVSMDNSHKNKGSIAHALLCIGHEHLKDVHYEKIESNKFSSKELLHDLTTKEIEIFDYDNIKENFIFIDDNHPVYQVASFEKPANHYDTSWHDCTIKYFIVPLYQKIYLEAYEAKKFITNFLLYSPYPLKNKSKIIIRTFLTTTRSFKNKIALNESFSEDIKEIILEKEMPKFIWVSELSEIDLLKNKKANGLIILDATEANTNFFKPLILAAYQNNIIHFDEKSGSLKSYSINLPVFSIYENNLKSY